MNRIVKFEFIEVLLRYENYEFIIKFNKNNFLFII
jgi:hypothetical protein